MALLREPEARDIFQEMRGPRLLNAGLYPTSSSTDITQTFLLSVLIAPSEMHLIHRHC
jgi:hypothetical protein